MSWNEPGGDNKDPWGSPDGQKGPPDLDEAIRKAMDKLSSLFGGSGNGGGEGANDKPTGNPGKLVSIVGIAAGILWLLSGTYMVDAGNKGVVTRFGRYVDETTPGLNWHFPAPIEQVQIVNVEQNRTLEIRTLSSAETSERDKTKGTLMLTRDENYVDVLLVVQYKVGREKNSARNFLFNLVDPAITLKQVTESAERGVIGSSDMDFVLTGGRTEVVAQIRKELQDIMNRYQSGIEITSVNLKDAQAPAQVQDAFQDVIKAREDKERLINEAKGYSNDIVPKARGAAARMLEEAQGYRDQVIAQAEGEASRFTKLLHEYAKQPDVTRKRLYIETMEAVLSDANIVMVDVKGSNNFLYLPLDKMGPTVTGAELQAVAQAQSAKTESYAEQNRQDRRESRRERSPRGRRP